MHIEFVHSVTSCNTHPPAGFRSMTKRERNPVLWMNRQ